ncbi:hypothetical protein [Deinococcus petrolearius]|uniref:AAA+ ATPase domain-containing protein n=1 Tax=Deinococcus petrolearius TaxID=1751295 RepID=A0ABW1DPJ9_9DEIO
MTADPLLSGLVVNLASSLMYDLGKLALHTIRGGEDPVRVAIRAAADHHSDRALIEDALREWINAASLDALLREAEHAHNHITPQRVIQSLASGGNRARQLSEQPYVGKVVQNFLQELNAALLRSPDGPAVIDARAQARSEALTARVDAITTRLDAAPAFLTLNTFRDVLYGIDLEGYRVPYVRTDWEKGTAPVQQETAALMAGGARVGLLTAPGGYGKTRLILELGLWAHNALQADVVVTDPHVREYAGQLRHLPTGQRPLLILVDNAEQANVPALLNELSKDPALRGRTKVLALTRTTFGPELEQALLPYGSVAFTLTQLPTLKYTEAEHLLEHLDVHGDDLRHTIYQRSNGVPLFLILSARKVEAGENFFELPSNRSPLDLYLDDQLELIDRAGHDRATVRRVLGTLAWLSRLTPNSVRDLTTLALLSSTDEATANAILQAGSKVNLIDATRGRFRFTYDLVRERMAVREISLDQALGWLGLFDFRQEGNEYAELLSSTVLLAFQRREDLSRPIQQYDEWLNTLNVNDRRAFAATILPAVRRADGHAALRWAARLIREVLPPVTQEALGRQIEITHPQLVPVVLEQIKPLVQIPEFRRDVLGLAVLAGTQGDAALQAQVRQLLEFAATPRLFDLYPLAGLDVILDVARQWAGSGEAFLHRCALTVLERLALLEVSDATSMPDSSLTVNIRQGRLPLTHPTYRDLYTRVQEQVRELPDGVLATQPEHLGTLLGKVLGQRAFFRPEPGSAEEQAALEWLDVTRALAQRLDALPFRHAARMVERLADTGHTAIAASAQQLLTALDTDPIHHLVALTSNAPSRHPTQDEDRFDWQAHLARRREEQRQMALQVTGAIAAAECADLIVKYRAVEPDENFSTLILALLSADPEYALTVHRQLVVNPDTRPKMLAVLYHFEPTYPWYVTDTLNDVLAGDDANAITAVMGTALSRFNDPQEFRTTISRFARHPHAHVRANLVQMNFMQPEDQQFAVEEVLAAGQMDRQVGRAVIQGLKDLSYLHPIPGELMKRFLTATEALPLEDITTYDDGLSRIAAELATQDPLWLIEHIEARSARGPSGSYQDADVLARLFDGMEAPSLLTPERLDLHQQIFQRLWKWQQETGWTLTSRSAPDIFRRFTQLDPDSATQFLRQAISVASDIDMLHHVMKWVFTLPSPLQAGELADEVVVRAEQLQATSQETEELQGSVISYSHSPMRSKLGRGPFPSDVALKDLAETRLNAAQKRLVMADPAALTLKDFWTSILAHANERIHATLDRENDWYGPETG